MSRWLANLAFTRKIALPVAVLMAVLGAIVWSAETGLGRIIGIMYQPPPTPAFQKP